MSDCLPHCNRRIVDLPEVDILDFLPCHNCSKQIALEQADDMKSLTAYFKFDSKRMREKAYQSPWPLNEAICSGARFSFSRFFSRMSSRSDALWYGSVRVRERAGVCVRVCGRRVRARASGCVR